MNNILALLQCVTPSLAATKTKQLSRIIRAMLVMTGRVTMLGIARWAEKGGSYRTVQRFYAAVIPWANLYWVFFREQSWHPGDTYLLVGDETVVTKAGKHTHGLDRFFSGLYGKAIPGVSFFALSLVSVQERHAYPISVEQIVRDEAEKVASKAKAEAKKKGAGSAKGKRGRPKGSKNKNKAEVVLSPELVRIKTMVIGLLQRIAGCLSLNYLVMDGHFGNNNALVMTRSSGLHLISKLRCDSKLYLPYEGPHSGAGAPRKYGDRLVYRSLPAQYLKSTVVKQTIKTDIYHMKLRHKDFCQALNVVIIVKTNQRTGACAHVCLFSSELDLAYDKLIDFYSLRFQIEIIFKEGKGEIGLDHSETRSWLGWHHPMLLVALAPHFLVRLRVRLKGKAPALTIYQVRLLLTSLLPKPLFDAAAALHMVRYYQQRNYATSSRVNLTDSAPMASSKCVIFVAPMMGEWMTRNFTLTFAAVTLRLQMPFLALVFGAEMGCRIVAWSCRIPNVLVAEWIVRRALLNAGARVATSKVMES